MHVKRRMTCEEALRQLFAYLDRALSGETLESFEEHLGACLACCDRLEFSRRLDAFVKERLWDAALPEPVERNFRRTIRERQAARAKA